METKDLVHALLDPFVAGFVVQRFLEILDTYTTAKITDPNRKKFVMGMLSLLAGWALAWGGHMTIFAALKHAVWCPLDIFFSGIFISAGTEGFNSVMKFASYKKEATKADAADKELKLSAQQRALGIAQS